MINGPMKLSPEALERARNAANAAYAKLDGKVADDNSFLATIWSRNPWRERHSNLTNQMRVTRLDPKLAAELEESALRLDNR